MEITDNGELLIGESDPVRAGLYQPIAPVQDIHYEQEKNTLKFKWRPEEIRYFGVNIYRKTAVDTSFFKMNKVPIVVSKQRDSKGQMKYPDIMFEDDSLTANKTYTYQFRAIDVFWGDSQPYTVEVTVKDLIPPYAAYDLKARVDTFRIHLRWKNAENEDANGSTVYRSHYSEGPFDKVSVVLPPTDTGYIDTISLPGAYYYYVSTQDHGGNESASMRTFVEVGDVIPPAQPKGFTIESDTGLFRLTWHHNTEGDLKGYLLFRTINEDNPNNYVLMNAEPMKENFYIQTLPTNVKNAFLYKLVAVDTFYNRSEASEIVKASMPDVTAPEQPFIRSVKQFDNERILIEWLPNVDSDLMGYTLYRAYASDSSEYSILNPQIINVDSTRYVDGFLPKNGDYFYRLTAQDSVGNVSAYSDPVVVSFEREKPAPPPRNLRVHYDERTKCNMITWESESPGEVMGFIVYRKSDKEVYRPLTGMLQATNYTDTTIRKGTRYVYQVRAYTHRGDMARSEEVGVLSKNEK